MTDQLEDIKQDHLYAVDALSVYEVNALHQIILTALRDGKKILICGCGGSAADAQHYAAELVGRFETQRWPVAAIALTTDSSILTAIGNDFGFDKVFARQVAALGKPGDVLVAISTSGKTPAILEAVREARAHEMLVLGLTGKNGEAFAAMCDRWIQVDSANTARIQEVHGLIIHMLCFLIDKSFRP